MRIVDIDSQPIHEIAYRYPARGGGAAYGSFGVLRAVVEGLPPELDGLLVTSDLQGVAPSSVSDDGSDALLGFAVAEELFVLAEVGEIPAADRIGVILAGDLFVSPALESAAAKATCGAFGWPVVLGAFQPLDDARVGCMSMPCS